MKSKTSQKNEKNDRNDKRDKTTSQSQRSTVRDTEKNDRNDRKNASQSRIKAKEKSYTQGDNLKEEFEDMLMDLSLKRPKTAYNFFITEMYKKNKEKGPITETIKEFSNKWAKTSDNERKKYDELHDEDKERYQAHLAMVKKHLLEKPKKENVTAYRIYLDEMATKAIDEDRDLKEARNEARENWKNLTNEARKEYEDKKDKLSDLYDELRKNTKGVSGYQLFIKDKMKAAREKGEGNTLGLKDAALLWNKTNAKVKENYERYAEEVRDERMRQRNLYEIAFGIKPRRPMGAFKMFMSEKAKEGKFDGLQVFKEAHKMWRRLTDEEKEKYVRAHQKEKLAHVLKKMEYNAQIRKNYYRARSAFNLFAESLKGKIDAGKTEGGSFAYISSQWKKASDETKRKFEKLSEEDKKKAERIKVDFKAKVFDEPKKPISAFNRFIRERLTESSKAGKGNGNITELFGDTAKEWTELTDKEKENYQKAVLKDTEIYEEQVKSFKDYGYYDKRKEQSQFEKNRNKSRRDNSDRKERSKSRGREREDKDDKEDRRNRDNKSQRREASKSRGKEDNKSQRNERSKSRGKEDNKTERRAKVKN